MKVLTPKAATQTSTERRFTRRQREVIDYLTEHDAFTSATASNTYATDEGVADKLADLGFLNKRYDGRMGAMYWIRARDEAPTGALVPAGFSVILHRDLTTPGGRGENFFLARAPYDGKGTTFRRLLRGWMQKLDLRNKDLVGGYVGFEVIEPDAAVFGGDHVILDDL